MSNIFRCRTLKISFGIAVLMAVVLIQGALADDWPLFRHDPARTGVSGDTVTPPLNLLWNYTTGSSVSPPAVSGGVAYVGTSDGNLYALDAATGAFKWKYLTGGSVQPSPAVSGGVVYIGSSDHSVYALDAATGALKWKYTTLLDIEGSSPAVSGGVVYVGSLDQNVYALDAATGALKWQYLTGRGIDSSPAVSGGVVYVGSHDHNVYALDASTGALKWSYATGYDVVSSPAVSGGVVYVGSLDQNVYALDAATGTKIWNYTTGGGIDSSPAASGGAVYVGSHDHNVYALDASTGALKWKYTTGREVISSPAVSGSVVYVGSLDDNLYALDAATGIKIWNYTTGGAVSSPAVSDGAVYAGSSDYNVYAFSQSRFTVAKDFRFSDVNFSATPAELGILLPQNGSNFNVTYVTKPKDGTVSSTNPGQLYGVIAINGTGVVNATVNDTFSATSGTTQFMVNPAKLEGGVEVIRVNTTTGDATVLTNTTQVTSATIDNAAGKINVTVNLDTPLASDEKLMVYIKFKTALKGVLPNFADFVNTAAIATNLGMPQIATATIGFV